MRDIVDLVPISSSLQTSFHVKGLLFTIERIKTEIFKKEKQPMEIMTKDVPFPLSENLKNLAAEHEYDLNSAVEADLFLDKLREAVSKLPVLSITLGLPPSLDIINDVNNWVLTNVKGFVVLDFVEDKALIAGAVIRYAGKTRDYSVRKYSAGLATVDSNAVMVRNRE